MWNYVILTKPTMFTVKKKMHLYLYADKLNLDLWIVFILLKENLGLPWEAILFDSPLIFLIGLLLWRKCTCKSIEYLFELNSTQRLWSTHKNVITILYFVLSINLIYNISRDHQIDCIQIICLDKYLFLKLAETTKDRK